MVFAIKPSRGIFWDIDGKLFAFPYVKNIFDSGLSKSRNTYVHKKLWMETRPKGCHKPYNYYPRGRVEINSKQKPVVYMNPNVDKSLVPEIIIQFGLTQYPRILYDNSQHYKCYLDDGWVAGR